MPPVHQKQVEEQVEEQAEQQAVQQAWPGGPIDTSLLTRYEHHVARHVWFGQERVEGDKIELRIVSLGRKLADRIPDHHPQVIQGWLNISGLCWLERTSLKFTDPQLISAFVERWHPETSSFHMPFGEMTITLDDVACLLHLPVRGQFYTPVSVSQEQAAELAVELLGEEYEFALRETVAQRGGYFSQQWLYESYNRNANLYGKYDCAARAWMLMLVGSTILADKSYTRVDAKWLLLFSDLSAVHTYSWASIALVCLYDNLNDASMFSTRALAGYATLLQCWIHEYFPTLGRRAQSDLNCDNPGFPRAMRWMYKQGKTKLPDYRPILDALTPDDVIWRPFETHRGSIPFDLITLYSGHLRGSTVVPYLPERCIRQFGFVQYIPPPPPLAPAYSDIDSDWIGYHASVDRILQPTRPVTYASETVPDYMSWYYRVSHPRLCRPVDGPHGAPPVPHYAPAPAPAPDAPVDDAPADDAPQETALQRERRWRGMARGALETFLTRIDADRDDEDFEELFFALDVCRGAYP
ncbi:unnamed protein product [Trifolium pratense]|uniref:Uncharacterized protein n=1 Tax=Trifolium pratense TaxID=57577 RepID=A0ACB0LV25_TRIPR|nr:unnamed protein product [Trifolium pratense]